MMKTSKLALVIAIFMALSLMLTAFPSPVWADENSKYVIWDADTNTVLRSTDDPAFFIFWLNFSHNESATKSATHIKVTLNADLELSDPGWSLLFNNKQIFTLDGNGYSIIKNVQEPGISAGQSLHDLIKVGESGNVTLNNVVIDAGSYYNAITLGQDYTGSAPGYFKLNGVTVQNSYWDGGAGIFISNPFTLDVENSTFTNNMCVHNGAALGGAIYSGRKTPVTINLKDSQFIGNGVTSPGAAYGGAVRVQNGVISIDGCTFTKNFASRGSSDTGVAVGGSIAINAGVKLNVTNTIFDENHADDFGGAIWTENASDNNPLDLQGVDQAAYSDLQFGPGVKFTNNTAGKFYQPPQNYADLDSRLKVDKTSFTGKADLWADSVLNNYDVNYAGDYIPALYTITYDPNGGQFEGMQVDEKKMEQHQKDDVITIIDPPTREGYVFDYWQGSEYQPGDQYTVTGDHTFVAQWKPAGIPEIYVPVPLATQPLETIPTVATQPVAISQPTQANLVSQAQELPATGARESLSLALCLLSAGIALFMAKKSS